MEADASQSHAGKKVNSYSTEFKLEAVRFAVECSSRELKHQTFFGRRRRLQTSEHGYEGAVVPAKIQT